MAQSSVVVFVIDVLGFVVGKTECDPPVPADFHGPRFLSECPVTRASPSLEGSGRVGRAPAFNRPRISRSRSACFAWIPRLFPVTKKRSSPLCRKLLIATTTSVTHTVTVSNPAHNTLKSPRGFVVPQASLSAFPDNQGTKGGPSRAMTRPATRRRVELSTGHGWPLTVAVGHWRRQPLAGPAHLVVTLPGQRLEAGDPSSAEIAKKVARKVCTQLTLSISLISEGLRLPLI